MSQNFMTKLLRQQARCASGSLRCFRGTAHFKFTTVVVGPAVQKTTVPGAHARQFCAIAGHTPPADQLATQAPPLPVEVDFEDLQRLTPTALAKIREAFVGPKSYGLIQVVNIPSYKEKRRSAFRAGIDLALLDAKGRKRAAAVSNTYPGWSGTPGEETHPLQSSFLFNVKEECPGGKPDPYFGKNIFPSEEYRKTWGAFAVPMHDIALQVLGGIDVIVEEQVGTKAWSGAGRSLHRMAKDGPALAGRFICYDSGYTREDTLLDQAEHEADACCTEASLDVSNIPESTPGHAADGLASMRTHSTPVKSAGHAGDGLASMRTHSTPVKSAGHAGDGLASMRTHSTPVKSAGHAGDGLASMRTHSTPVKSAGHAGDGLASMRTHSTPVKSAGHAGDGLASMRTHSTPVKSAGHAGDGLASMRTHSTPVKSAGHAGDGLASMRTHSTPVKSAGHAGDGLASMRTHSTPVKSAGHAGDGLASMRTHSTPVKSAGHAGDGLASMRTHSTPVKSAGHAGDGLASMRTHSTPVKSAGHAGDGLASMRTHSTPVKSAGKSASMKSVDNASSMPDLASSVTHSTPVRPSNNGGDGLPSGLARNAPVKPAKPSIPARQLSTESMVQESTDMHFPPLAAPIELDTKDQQPALAEEDNKGDLGDYWLPWHIDSNFITVLHKGMYAREDTAEFVPEPPGAGLRVMNLAGDICEVEAKDDDSLLLQLGAFAQIYAGGLITSSRHAVRTVCPPGVARFNFCNFWYVPWTTLCDAPEGHADTAVTKGWNAMMDESYLDITMKQSFSAFRQFMTSPEARVQFADSVPFKELSELFPLPAAAASTQQLAATASQQMKERAPAAADLVVDVLTDVRCPFSHLSHRNLELALERMGLNERALIRYHPVFLNPNVPKEGESLDDYLLREYGYTKEYAHSEHYPIRVAGLEVGVNFNPNRRVVNTFDAFCLIEAASELGKQREVVAALSRRYFEDAEDISDESVLRRAAEDAGLDGAAVMAHASSDSVRWKVEAEYQELAARVGEVPHFLLRERISGNGVDAGGNRSVEAWEELLGQVLDKSRFVGMAIPGPYGKEVWLPEANPNGPVSLALPAQHSWSPEEWPFTPQHFERMDTAPDTAMYSQPRIDVQHLDEITLSRLTSIYRQLFGSVAPGFSVLDLCSSWTSHFPGEFLAGARVAVHGLNEAELKANKQATEHHMQDLNANPVLPWSSESFDFVTLTLSVQYLTDPRAVFAEMHRALKPGGMAVIAFSHRCFIEKAISAWAEEPADGEGHAHLICRYFQHGPRGGWTQLRTIDASPRHGDPLWLVTAVKAGTRPAVTLADATDEELLKEVQRRMSG